MICIVGVGYVGEHLVEVFSRGYNVVGYDISSERILELSKKGCFQKDNIVLTSDPDSVDGCKVFLISVPTLVREDKTINNDYLESACTFVRDKVKEGDLVVIESTVSIGTTRKLMGDLREQGIFVGFSPERVDPGRISPKSYEIPKVVSGVDSESLNRVKDIYGKVFNTIVPVSNCETAEMVKLYENCFRLINVTYINEISDACKEHGINVDELIQAASTKPFGFMPFSPSLGVGGSCIPVNPYYLFHNCELPFLKMAIDTASKRPVDKASLFMADDIKEDDKVLFVGIGFKPGQGLTLYSPAVSFVDRIYSTLCSNSDKYVVYDPLVTKVHSKHTYNMLDNKKWTTEYIDSTFDVVCLLVTHPCIDLRVLQGLKRCRVIDKRHG